MKPVVLCGVVFALAGAAHADVSAAATSWTASCEGELRRAAKKYDGDNPWFDLWWHWRVTPRAIEVRYTASVDICGVYDDFRIRVKRGQPAQLQKLHDDGGDFVVWRKLFEPALKVCLSGALRSSR